jgi:hypothetical protein
MFLVSLEMTVFHDFPPVSIFIAIVSLIGLKLAFSMDILINLLSDSRRPSMWYFSFYHIDEIFKFYGQNLVIRQEAKEYASEISLAHTFVCLRRVICFCMEDLGSLIVLIFTIAKR